MKTAKYNNRSIKKSSNNKKSKGITNDGGRLSLDSIPMNKPMLRITPLIKKHAKAMVMISIFSFFVLLYDNAAITSSDSAKIIMHGIKIS